MSFPERLSLSHLIDGENEKDAMMSKECRADSSCNTHLDASPSLDRTAAAAVDADRGKHIYLLDCIVVRLAEMTMVMVDASATVRVIIISCIYSVKS